MTIGVTADASKANLDSSGDDVAAARADLADLVDKFNSLKATVAGLDAILLLLSGGTLTGNLALKNTTGSGKQVQFLNTSAVLRARFSLDDDASSPQRFRYRFLDTDGTTALADMVFGDSIIYWQLDAATQLQVTPGVVSVPSGIVLKVGASQQEVYSPDNPPPATGGWEDVRTATYSDDTTDTISIADPTNGLLASGYDYRLRFTKPITKSSGSAHVDIQLGTGTSTITWNSGNYDSILFGAKTGSASINLSSSNNPYRLTLDAQVGSGTSKGLMGYVDILSPMNSAIKTQIIGHFYQQDQPGAFTIQGISRNLASESALKMVIGAGNFGPVEVVLQRRPVPGSAL